MGASRTAVPGVRRRRAPAPARCVPVPAARSGPADGPLPSLYLSGLRLTQDRTVVEKSHTESILREDLTHARYSITLRVVVITRRNHPGIDLDHVSARAAVR